MHFWLTGLSTVWPPGDVSLPSTISTPPRWEVSLHLGCNAVLRSLIARKAEDGPEMGMSGLMSVFGLCQEGAKARRAVRKMKADHFGCRPVP